MPSDLGSYGRAPVYKNQPKASPTSVRNAQGEGTSLSYNRFNQAYLNQLGQMLYGGMPMGGSMGGFGGGGRGGGGGGRGGGGGGSYDAFRIAEEQRRQQELEQRKAALTQQLTGAREQALPMLDQYQNQYNSNIGNIFSQNQALTGGYSNQLAALMQQMNAGTQNTQAMLQRDLGNQGANGPEMQAMNSMAQMNMAGHQQRSQNADAYNLRLAQMMAQAQADAQAMGATIGASSRGNLENSYANLLAQIGLIGLQ